MSTQDQARALMLRHRHAVKNRQQSMLGRLNAEVGIPGDVEYFGTLQGKPSADARLSYDRSSASMS